MCQTIVCYNRKLILLNEGLWQHVIRCLQEISVCSLVILDYLKDHFYVDKMKSVMGMYGAEQIITKPTCYVVTSHKNVLSS